MKDMMNKLIRRLEKNSDVSGWLIAQEQALSAQGFYVLQKLETRRVADTTEYKVTVYRDFQEDGTSYTGSASFLVSHDLTAAQIDRQIREALYAASFVKNPAYTLVEGGPKKTFRGRSFGEDPFQIIDQVAEAFFARSTPEARFNSFEVFITQTTTRIRNSRGVDRSKRLQQIFVEAIPSCYGAQKVELYKTYRYDKPDREKMSMDAAQALADVALRCQAVRPEVPIGTCAVLLRQEEARGLFYELIWNYSYAGVVKGTADKKIGDALQPDPRGDVLDIRLEAPSKADMFDQDGALAVPTQVVAQGLLNAYYGNNQYGCYLGLPSTGSATALHVGKGRKSVQSMKKKPYVEIVAMSGIQIDVYSDYIGGEVRLANYFDGERLRPISGFSISGSIRECLKDLGLSREGAQIPNYTGPAFVRLPNMNIL